LVWAVINEVFPGYAPFSRQALKSKVSFQALLDAPGKFGEGLQWVITGHSGIVRFRLARDAPSERTQVAGK
jgi:hypothetical protein